MSKISEQLKFFRKESGITQKQLSEMTGIAEITIRQYEAGKYKPKLENIRKISEALGVQVAALLDIDEADQALNPLLSIPSISINQENPYDIFELKKLEGFFSLNEKGKSKALSYINDLVKLPEYTIDN